MTSGTSIDRDQTTQNVQSDLGSTLSTEKVILSREIINSDFKFGEKL